MVPGSANRVFPFLLSVDIGIKQLDSVALNAGSLTESLVLATNDYLQATQAVELFAFAK